MPNLHLNPHERSQSVFRQDRINQIIAETVYKQQQKKRWKQAFILPAATLSCMLLTFFCLVNLNDAVYISALSFKPSESLTALFRLNDNFETLFIQGVAQPVETTITDQGMILKTHFVAIDGFETTVFLTVETSDGKAVQISSWINQVKLVDLEGNVFPSFTGIESTGLSAVVFRDASTSGTFYLRFGQREVFIETNASAITKPKILAENISLEVLSSTMIIHRLEVGLVRTKIEFSLINGEQSWIMNPKFKLGGRIIYGQLLNASLPSRYEMWLDVGLWNRIEGEPWILESVEKLELSQRTVMMDVERKELINLPSQLRLERVTEETNGSGQLDVVFTLSSSELIPTYFFYDERFIQTAEQNDNGKWESRIIVRNFSELSTDIEMILRTGPLVEVNKVIPLTR